MFETICKLSQYICCVQLLANRETQSPRVSCIQCGVRVAGDSAGTAGESHNSKVPLVLNWILPELVYPWSLQPKQSRIQQL